MLISIKDTFLEKDKVFHNLDFYSLHGFDLVPMLDI